MNRPRPARKLAGAVDAPAAASTTVSSDSLTDRQETFFAAEENPQNCNGETMNKNELAGFVMKQDASSLESIICYLEEVVALQGARDSSPLEFDYLLGLLNMQNALPKSANRMTNDLIGKKSRRFRGKEQESVISITAMSLGYDEFKQGLIAQGVSKSEIYCVDSSHSEKDEISRIIGAKGLKHIVTNPYFFTGNWRREVIPALHHRLLEKRGTAKGLRLLFFFINPESMTSLQIANGVQLLDYDANADITNSTFLLTSVENAYYVEVLRAEADKNKGWSADLITDNLVRAVHSNDTRQIRENIQLVRHNYRKKEVWKVLENTIDLLEGIETFDKLPRRMQS